MSERITTPFGFETTALEVVEGVDLSGRRAVVTGGASGIGVETVRALAAAGAEVTIAARNAEAGRKVAAELSAATGNDRIFVAPLELTSQDSVQEFVRSWDGPLHLLINNAGVMATPLTRTPEGWELQFATNHFGHFALTLGLFGALRAEGARVVNVSSAAHLSSPVVFDDIHFERREYDRWQAYGQSKTANVLFGVEAGKRWAGEGITMNALMPGGILTALQRHITREDLEERRRLRGAAGKPMQLKTPEQGAATTLVLAVSPLVEGRSGLYFEDCEEALPHTEGMPNGLAAYAHDQEAAAQLWQVSEETLKIGEQA
ncbi:NAD(P)-dependent dehydrogenase (short-subunit alcohol dehydrogenase family) [Lentzea atacamensis]|uniref:Probable oxidoreductase n=1 Tax=Lentzea atacamensis TaxID=531938 RepID=A0A316HN75_9PSEU|nr:SDR family NAD(P)-dependent oxidoreductase [Lentzea atacamensis]PWK81454.1 NAD(P)-dependent dehydrogenase (short-subunit alcohol dehydrogenase family) [Lentzea atacamensis]RAS70601.1 NAD(P)-dependent dehydrogenase (short-subunit alcohol dehydrogenase family) [Lentzea atacamensis]